MKWLRLISPNDLKARSQIDNNRLNVMSDYDAAAATVFVPQKQETNVD